MPSIDSKPSPHLADAAKAAGVGVKPRADLADRIEDVLPQTQCTKCGYAGCRPYAEAIASGEANYNQCPPGGQQGIARLAAVLGKPVIFLNVDHGQERERPVAMIDEKRCIGCTLCIQACPVDAILGAAKEMHVILPDLCTGCDLCVPACPVDCIDMLSVTQGRTGWNAWSQEAADAARDRHDFRTARLLRERQENDARLAAKAAAKMAAVNAETPVSNAEHRERERKKAIIAAAIERARLQKLAAQEGPSAPVSGPTSESPSDSASAPETPTPPLPKAPT